MVDEVKIHDCDPVCDNFIMNCPLSEFTATSRFYLLSFVDLFQDSIASS